MTQLQTVLTYSKKERKERRKKERKKKREKERKVLPAAQMLSIIEMIYYRCI